MFKNHLKLALRVLRRQKIYSLMNVSGLAIGMACTILILLWVQDELSYDRFHDNANQIYRVVAEWKENSAQWAKTPGLLAAAMKEEIPEVVNAARLHKRPRLVIRYGDKAFYEDGKVRADPALFEMLTFPFVAGDRDALASGMVITESMAQKYFGDENPIGKTLNVNNWFDAQVTGVIKDLPHNSYFQFDCVLALESLKRFWPGGFTWGNFSHETYVQLETGADPEIVSNKTTQLLIRKFPQIAPYLNKLYLQPLTEVYLTAGIGGNQFTNGDRKYVYIFSVVACFVLVIACINFMNLATARSLNRAKEVGLRKVIGSSRMQLIKQFLGESVLLTAFATVLAVILVELLLPAFNQLASKSLALNYFDAQMLLGLGGITLVTGIISGSYPALYLSSFKPVAILKGAAWLSPFQKGAAKAGLRRALVVTQFALSIILIVSTIVIHNQLHYLTHKKLGFEKDNVIYVPAKANFGTQYEAAKQELQKYPEILGVSAKGCLPTNTLNTSLVLWEGKAPDRDFPVETNAVDYDYLDLLSMEIAQGRNFSKEHATDAVSAFVINEEAASMMGLESPVGKEIRVGQSPGTIIGVVKNAHFKSLRQKIEPQIFHVLTDYNSELVDLFGIVLIKIKGEHIPQALAGIERVWKQVNPNFPFEFHFLDETYDHLYNQEKRTSTIFDYFTILAIAISCMGLFGLATYIAENRTKEIGIRKVLGATVARIVVLLTGDFIKWVLLANVVAWPIAWYLMQHWLQDFAYRIEISWWMFALAGGSALVIALITVSMQAIKAAVANPVEALRYE
jgi:ABC-type antimicrobial peptide transport system permease subunit